MSTEIQRTLTNFSLTPPYASGTPDTRYREREAQAAQWGGLAQEVKALTKERQTYEMVIKELSASSSQTEHEYACQRQRLDHTVTLLARYLPIFADFANHPYPNICRRSTVMLASHEPLSHIEACVQGVLTRGLRPQRARRPRAETRNCRNHVRAFSENGRQQMQRIPRACNHKLLIAACYGSYAQLLCIVALLLPIPHQSA
jgi:hypothetical protein